MYKVEAYLSNFFVEFYEVMVFFRLCYLFVNIYTKKLFLNFSSNINIFENPLPFTNTKCA